ncbi:MAG: glycosyltransferase family 4 protein [Bacteroidales bacterium]|jgi:glycosyltransferase involved in cell wall biosynthesis|nr:glycosyltransferase family 4 protein [Bacteroidales bacterium]
MKVLMFGWEFPPHISGGLGTACYGLTKGLSTFPDIEILFVVPKMFGDENRSNIGLIGANNIPVRMQDVRISGFLKELQKIEVGVNLLPYVDPEIYEKYSQTLSTGTNQFITSDFSGKIDFSGGYGKNLMGEIFNYALVSASIALNRSFDVIHAHDWLCYPAGIAAKYVSGKPLVIHVHATDFDRSGGNVNPAVFAVEKQGMEIADKIITVSNLTRNIVIEKYGIDPAKVVTVYNAVEPVEKYDGRLKKFDEKIVTFLGRITMQKGPEYFIEAASLVLKKMDNVRFVMAGSGDMMNKMIRRAARLGIMDKFNFTGFLKSDDVYQMFHLSDVYVMPSVSEPFGISPLEAMQSNVPVIISRQSGVAEVLKHAVKIDFWDTYAMADAIYGILNYPALHSIFKKHGKQEVDQMKWEISAKHVRNIYFSIN